MLYLLNIEVVIFFLRELFLRGINVYKIPSTMPEIHQVLVP